MKAKIIKWHLEEFGAFFGLGVEVKFDNAIYRHAVRIEEPMNIDEARQRVMGLFDWIEGKKKYLEEQNENG